MGKVISLTQGSAEWLEFRRKSLGSTTASILAGVNPWKNPIDVYEEMVEGKVTPLNDAMRKGMELEEDARGWCEMELECALFPVTMRHKTIPFMHASFDGLSLDETVAVEIKCSKKCYDDAIKGKIPEYYEYQMWQQMLIGDLDFMYYCAYWDGKGKVLKLMKCDITCKDIELRAINFYESHIRPKCPPDDKKPVKHPVIELDMDTKTSMELNLINREEIVAKIKHLEDIKSYLDEQIINGANGESREIGKFKVTRYEVKGSVDYSLIECLNGVNLDAYRKPSRFQWRIQ